MSFYFNFPSSLSTFLFTVYKNYVLWSLYMKQNFGKETDQSTKSWDVFKMCACFQASLITLVVLHHTDITDVCYCPASWTLQCSLFRDQLSLHSFWVSREIWCSEEICVSWIRMTWPLCSWALGSLNIIICFNICWDSVPNRTSTGSGPKRIKGFLPSQACP